MFISRASYLLLALGILAFAGLDKAQAQQQPPAPTPPAVETPPPPVQAPVIGGFSRGDGFPAIARSTPRRR
jgi:hypothetical protein